MKRLIVILLCIPVIVVLLSMQGCASAPPLPIEDNDEWRPAPQHPIYVKV